MRGRIKPLFELLVSASDRTVGSSAVYRELPPGDFFTFTIPFSMKGSTDVSSAY